MKLVLPSVKYQESYLEALKEGKAEAAGVYLERPEEGQSFEEFIKNLLEQAKGLNLPEGFVAATQFWLIDKGEFIGRVSVRHFLNESLLKMGGHIGYYIRVSKRGRGYGKKILKMGLTAAKKLGITKALITCDINNTASARIIEANNGILENIVEVGPNLPLKKRYWIKIS